MKKYDPTWWASLPPERVGKETENLVEDVFKVWNERQDFAWHRLPDAKAARGRLAAQPADFLWRCGEMSGFLEVKALNHPYRLPASRLTQLPTLKKWTLASSKDIVLVHHYMLGLWTSCFVQELDFGVPSWDLRDFPSCQTAERALMGTGMFL